MITMQSWMFLDVIRDAPRAILLDDTRSSRLLHLGTGAFDTIGGEVVSTAAFVVRRSSTVDECRVSSMSDEPLRCAGRSEAAILRRSARGSPARDVDQRRQADFATIPGTPIAYWLSDAMRAALLRRASRSATSPQPRKGMTTGDNDRSCGCGARSRSSESASDASRAEAARASREVVPLQQGRRVPTVVRQP